MSHNKLLSGRKFQWVLLALTLAFIWGHSCMPISDSAAESGRVTEWLTPFLEVFVGQGNVTGHLVRKLAHFTEFAALGFQLPLLRRSRTWMTMVRSVELGFFAAFLDESIQFLSARGAQISDVWLDTGGVAFGVAVAVFFGKALLEKRDYQYLPNRKGEENNNRQR